MFSGLVVQHYLFITGTMDSMTYGHLFSTSVGSSVESGSHLSARGSVAARGECIFPNTSAEIFVPWNSPVVRFVVSDNPSPTLAIIPQNMRP
jgi:hypothetical protein